MRSVETIRRPGNPANGIKPYVMYVARLPTGKKTFARFKDAQAAIMEYESAVKSGVDLKERTLAEVLTEFMKSKFADTSGLSKATLNQARLSEKKITARFGSKPLKKLRQPDVEEWLEALATETRSRAQGKVVAITAKLSKIAADKRGVRARRKLAALEADAPGRNARLARTGPRATDKALAHLRRMFKFAISRRYTVWNPCDDVKAAKAPAKPLDKDVYSVAEINALLAATPAEHRPLLLVLTYGGLRSGEASALKWADLDLPKNRLHVNQSRESSTGDIKEPKTLAGTRWVAIPRFVSQALREHELRAKKDSKTFVFAVHMRRFKDDVYFPAQRRAKLKRIRLHDLRHTHASLAIATGADLAVISRQLGHANLSITLNTYAHAFARRTGSDLGAKVEEFVRRETDGPVMVPSDSADAAAGAP
jgi:integrase